MVDFHIGHRAKQRPETSQVGLWHAGNALYNLLDRYLRSWRGTTCRSVSARRRRGTVVLVLVDGTAPQGD